MLCAQFNDWERFRRYQAIRRRYSQRRPFSDFKDDIRRRRLEHGVQGDVHLQPDSKQQNRLQNWIEFQDYHFRKHEKFNREIADLQKELEEEPHDASIIRGRIASIERLRKMHDILLQWNEQQRTAMDAQQLPLIGEDDDGNSLKTGQRPSDVGRRKRQPEAHSVLGKARVSKAKHQRRGRRSQHEVQGPAPAVEHAKHPQTEISLSQGRKTKPRGTKDAALRQIRPQKVSKARVSAKRSSTKPPCDADQQQATSQVKSRRRKLSQPSQLTPELKIRKSRRVTRKPTRWVPDVR